MITIKLTDEVNAQDNAYRPNEPITGDVGWSELPTETEQVQVRLIWYTEGKGTQDFAIVASEKLDAPMEQGNHRFHFVAPNRPSRFSGKLISLIWAIEVIVFPSKETERKTIIISPSGSEIRLTPIERPSPLSRFRAAKMKRQ
jgi:hypothetical protein